MDLDSHGLRRRGILIRMRVAGLFVFVAALYLAGFSSALAQRPGVFAESFNHPAILYSTTAANTVVDELNRKLAGGSVTLTFDQQPLALLPVSQCCKRLGRPSTPQTHESR